MRIERASLVVVFLLICVQPNLVVPGNFLRPPSAYLMNSQVEASLVVNASSIIRLTEMSIGMNDYGPDVTGLYGDYVAYDLFQNWSTPLSPCVLRTWCAFGSQLGYDLGFGYRHVIFNGTTYEDAQNPAFYNWTYLDILSNVAGNIHGRWLLTFTGCPISLSRGGGPVDPPKNATVYAEVVAHVYRHYRYGWPNPNGTVYWPAPYYIEIGNEPDLSVFWNGTQAEFFDLYGNVSLRLRQLYPGLRIGGPGVANVYDGWAPAFLTYVKKSNLPLNFFSWHCYDDNSSKVVDAIFKGRRIVEAQGFTNVSLVFDEWGKSLDNDTGWDTMEAALHAADVLIGAEYAGVDATCFAMAKDAPIAYNHPLWGWEANFGLLARSSIPKLTYHCFEAFLQINPAYIIQVAQTPRVLPSPNLNFIASESTLTACGTYWWTNLNLVIVNKETRSVTIDVSFAGLPPAPIEIAAKELSAASISSGSAWIAKQNVTGQLQPGSSLTLELSPQSVTVIGGSTSGTYSRPISPILILLISLVLGIPAIIAVILIMKRRKQSPR